MIARELQFVAAFVVGLAIASQAQAQVTGSVSSTPFVNIDPNQTDFQPGDQISVVATATASVPATDPAADVFFDIEIQGTGSSTSTFKTIQPGAMADFDPLGVFYNVPMEYYEPYYTALIHLWYVDETMGVTDIAVDYEIFSTD